MTAHADASLKPVLALTGALAGLVGWFLNTLASDWVGDPRSLLFLSSATFGFFAMLLALLGPARLWPTVPLVGVIALLAAALLWSASFRHEDVATFLQLSYPIVVFSTLLVIATPFAAAALWSWRGWRDYPTLFELSWRILVRYASAAIFTLLFWGLLTLSDALLQLVGLDLFALVERYELIPWVLTGTVFGFALAAVHEMRDYLSPFLVLRLLRLFVPVVLAVVLLFLVMAAARGLGGLVGSLSAAGTLMAAGLAAVLLVTVSVDRDPLEQVGPGWLERCVQALALLIPVLGTLALFAVWERVEQYGWTPARLMAATVGVVVMLYGLAYAVAVLRGRMWAARIRSANVTLALVIAALGVLWLSPVFVPERIAAQDQLARYQAGSLPAKDMAIRELSRDWGYPGLAALDALAGDPGVAEQVAILQTWRTTVTPKSAGQELRRALAQALVVQGGSLQPDMLTELGDNVLLDWHDACTRRVAGGPGCYLVLAAFVPGDARISGLLFLHNGGTGVNTQALELRDGKLVQDGYAVDAAAGSAFDLPMSVLEALHRGEGRVGADAMLTLQVGGHAFFPDN